MAKDDPEGKGYVAFPNDLPLRYFEELVSERRVAVKRMGTIVYRWDKPDRQANECHDTAIYAIAAGIKYGVNWISDAGWAERRATFEEMAGEVRPARRSIASQLAR